VDEKLPQISREYPTATQRPTGAPRSREPSRFAAADKVDRGM
jgi:hypothetical protein